jgi:hypothetical protein
VRLRWYKTDISDQEAREDDIVPGAEFRRISDISNQISAGKGESVPDH